MNVVVARKTRQVVGTVAILAALLLASVVALALAKSSSAAITISVNSTSDATDADPGNGMCATADGKCTLRAAIQEANALPGADTVNVPAGTYELQIAPLNQNDITTGDLDITEALTITGAGSTSTIIDGGLPKAGLPDEVQGMDRLFDVQASSGTVSLSGLTIRDGYAAEYGGGLFNGGDATVTLANIDVTGNFAGKTGGGIDNHAGGTVHVSDSNISMNVANESGSALNNNRGGTLTVTNTTVSKNSAAAVGRDPTLSGAGAISNNAELDTKGTIKVTRSQIFENAAGGSNSGAAISNDGGGTVEVRDSKIYKNTSQGDGGAIFNGSGDLTVADSILSENTADNGGAIHNSIKGGRVTITNSTITLNKASVRGGGISTNGTGDLNVSGTTFTKNSATNWGGGLLNDDKGSVSVTNCTFSENTALNGAGFANEGTGLVTVEGTTFTKNTADLATGEGGGLHTNSVGEVYVTGGSFTENRAQDGAGLSNEGGGKVVVSGTKFSTNTAGGEGGGVLVQSGNVKLSGVEVTGNFSNGAQGGGGGVSYQGDGAVSVGESASIEGSLIRGNTAKHAGGGVDSRGDGGLGITTTTIESNTAGIGGGLHHDGDAPLSVTRSTLSGNYADNGGGIFTDGDGEAMLENTTVSTNKAGQFGGGLLVSSRLTSSSSTVANNSAPSGGGINNGGGDLVGDGFVFLRNTIVANNPTGGNCAGTMTSLGGNIDSADTCRFREMSDQPSTDPLLGPLQDNGGPTQTHALLAGSPAQDAALCPETPRPEDPACPEIDQRGVARPYAAGHDVGAFESELAPTDAVSDTCAARTERTVLADADSWISQGSAATNFGKDSILKVKSQAKANMRALVHFELPKAPPGCELVGATLRLNASASAPGRTLKALRADSSWTETGVSWGNQPAASGAAAATESGLGYREWDVTSQTKEMYSGTNNGFIVRDASESGTGFQQGFHSREKGSTNSPPELVLIFDGPRPPAPDPGPDTCTSSQKTATADADSWLSQSSATSNFGKDSILKVKSQSGANSRALVRFALPPVPSGCRVADAELRLYASSFKADRTVEALQISSPWTENSVSWSNRPATTGTAATAASAQGYVEWTVTSQVEGMYSGGNHGFLIRDSAEGSGQSSEQSFHSREKGTDEPPELVITFE
jgi:CSLREA domain-containing protein